MLEGFSGPFAKEALLDATERLFQLKERLSELTTKAYVTHAPPLLIQLLDDLRDRIAEKLIVARHRMETAQTLDEQHEAETRVRFLASFISGLHRWTEVLELSRPDHNPQQLVPALQFLSSSISWKGKVIVSPLSDIIHAAHADSYMYFDVYDDLFGEARERLGVDVMREYLGIEKGFFAKYPERFAALFFPVGAKNNILQHAIFGHELGHFADRVYRVHEIADTSLSNELADRLRDARDQSVTQFLDYVVSAIGEDNIPSTFHALDLVELEVTLTLLLDDALHECSESWLREIAADVFLVRLFGVAGFLSAATYFVSGTRLQKLADMARPGVQHPPVRLRLLVMLRELDRLDQEGILQGIPQALRDEVDRWRDQVEEARQFSPTEPSIRYLFDWQRLTPEHRVLIAILDQVYWGAEMDGLLAKIQDAIRHQTLQLEEPAQRPSFLITKADMDRVEYALSLLKSGVPPGETDPQDRLKLEDPVCVRTGLSRGMALSTIFNAAWTQRLESLGYLPGWVLPSSMTQFVQRRRREQDYLVLAAIEQAHLIERYRHRLQRRFGTQDVLIESPLLKHLLAEKIANRLIVTPLLNPPQQIAGMGIDLTLGTEFISTKKTRLAVIDPTDENIQREMERYHEMHYIPFGNSFILHPGEFILATTFEYLKLPQHLAADLAGRTSAGRLGITFATGPAVRPRYRGRLTLELINTGTLPLVLYPTMRIAHLRLHEVEPIPLLEPSKYDLSVGPEFSKLHEDQEISLLRSPSEQVILGLVGPMGTGKTEIARYLEDRHGFVKYSLVHLVLDEIKKEGLPETIPNMRLVGNDRRSRNPTFFADALISVIKKQTLAPRVVIDSIRNPAEVQALESFRPLFLLGVDADAQVRFEREHEKQGTEFPYRTLGEFLEWDCEDRGGGQDEHGQQIATLLSMATDREQDGTGYLLDTSDIELGDLPEVYRRVDHVMQLLSAMAVYAHL